jgi:RNA polymerase sigma factor (sigma-70 family)
VRVFNRGMTADDQELLRRYAQDGADEAFTELVHRYADLVWSSGFRVTKNESLSEEVVQSVFADLARKAHRFPENTVLAGWLYRAACLAASKAVRTETRRLRRERQAMELYSVSGDDAQCNDTTERLMPFLDQAMGALGETDRNAVVLRFFARKSLADVGAALGISDDAAQKRLSRALEKLRRVLQSKGIASSTTGLAAVLGAAGTQAAPAGMAGAVAVASLSLGSATGVSGIWAALTGTLPSELFTMKSNLSIAVVTLGLVGTPLIIQHKVLTQIRAENLALTAQATDLDTLQQRNAEMLTQSAAAEEVRRLRADQLELARLRAEAEELRDRDTENNQAVHQEFLAVRSALATAQEQARFAQEEVESAQLNSIINNLRIIDGAKQQWALEKRATGKATPKESDIAPYIPGNVMPTLVVGETYTIGDMLTDPFATVTSPLASNPGTTVNLR